jgi:thiol-disulfide isomerase/thioredoxin
MRPFRLALCACIFFVAASPSAFAQQASNPQSNNPPDAPPKRDAETEMALQNAVSSAGNDSAALVRNLKAYLQKYPDAPRKAAVYRALVEACDQVRDNDCALQYAEQLIAIRPDDSDMMLLAVNLLNERGDDASLARASGYVTRVLDRVEKATPDQKPARVSVADWQDGQAQLRTALYFVRGRVEYTQQNYDDAAKDLQTSYSIRPNALAAELLGGIAELHGDLKTAIEEYARAFVLPENGPAGKVDRREVRRQLGNVWRQVHGSDRGLGDVILAAYDRASSQPSGPNPNPAARNKDAKDTFAFVLRTIGGGSMPLAPLKGKVVALSFWATWCGPCRELEPMFDQVAKSYAGNADVAFLAVNTDDDESLVAPFLARQKWDVPAVYADGLDDFMKVESLPTVLVLGRNGEIVYRVAGLAPDRFTQSLNAAIQDARGPSH